MKKGSQLPIYQCRECEYRWSRGGGNIPCPKCGYDPVWSVHLCIRYGFDGNIQAFNLAPLAPKKDEAEDIRGNYEVK